MGDAVLKIGGDTSGAQAALASAERRLEALEAKLQRVKTTAEKPVKAGIDQVAAKMSTGSVGDNGIAARMAAAGQAQAKSMQYEAASADQLATRLQRLNAMRAGDESRSRFSPMKGVMANQTADANAQAAIVARWQASNNAQLGASKRADTQGIIAQVRAQAAARQAAAQHASELAKQPGLIESASASAIRYLGPLAMGAAAVKLIANEWSNVIDRQQKAGQSAVTFEAAMGEAVLNVGEAVPADFLRKRSLEISEQTGISPAIAATTLSQAIKSGGATNQAEAARLSDAAEVAARLLPNADAEKLSAVAGSISSTMVRTGATAEQAGGKVLSMHGKSNIANLGEGLSAVSPVLANMLAQGASEQMSEALMPALSQAIEDIHGDMSGHAASTFTQSLTEQFGQREGFKGKKNIPDLAMAAMNKDPELARQFFAGELENEQTGKKFGQPELGRGKAETFLRAIAGDKSLAGDEQVIQSYRSQYDEFLKSARTMDESGKLYTTKLGESQAQTPHLQASKIMKSATERNRLGGDDAMRGILREDMKQLLQSSGAGDLSQKIQLLEFDMTSGNALNETADTLKARAFQKRFDSYSWSEQMSKGLSFTREGQTQEQLRQKNYSVAKDPESERVAKSLEEAALALRETSRNLAPRPGRNGGVEGAAP